MASIWLKYWYRKFDFWLYDVIDIVKKIEGGESGDIVPDIVTTQTHLWLEVNQAKLHELSGVIDTVQSSSAA